MRVLIIAPLFAITFSTYEILQRMWRPGTRNPVDMLETDMETLRRSRIRKIATDLESEYGLHLRV